MKKILLLFVTFLTLQNFAQTDPTLSGGLETLTLNKGTIDVELLTQIIAEKQMEIKDEVLKRFLLRLFPDDNYTTKYYIQNCLNILLKEKNPLVIEKEILELTTNYALAMGVSYSLINSNDELYRNINVDFQKYIHYTNDNLEKDDFNKYENLKKKIRRKPFLGIAYLNRNLIRKEIEVRGNIKTNNSENFYLGSTKKYKSEKNRLNRKNDKLKRIKLRRSISVNDEQYNEFIKKIIKIDSAISYSNLDKNKKRKLLIKLQKLKFDDLKTLLLKYNQNEIVGKLDIFKKKKLHTILNLKKIIAINEIIEKIEKIDKIDKNSIQTLDTKTYSYKDLAIKRFELNNEYNSFIKGIKKDEQKKKISSENKKKIDSIFDTFLLQKEIKFGIILDVVSLALSEIEELQLKGFYKNKIDYTKSNYYLKLNNEFKDSLTIFKNNIKSRVKPYIINYGIIKEFISKNKEKNVGEILTNLQNIAIAELGKNLIKNGKLQDIEFFQDNEIKKNFESLKNLSEYKAFIEGKYIKKIDSDFKFKNYDLLKTTISQNKDNYIKLKELVSNVNSPQITLKEIDNFEIKLKIKNINIIKEIKSEEQSFISLFEDFNKLSGNNEEIIETIKRIKKHIEFDSNPIDFNEYVEFENPERLKSLKSDFAKISDDLEQIDIKEFTEPINEEFESLSLKNQFFKSYLNSLLYNIKNKKFNLDDIDTITLKKSSSLLATIYSQIKTLSIKEDISIQDILNFEDNFSAKLIEVKIRDSNNNDFYDTILKKANVIMPLLKLKAYQKIIDESNFKYNKELLTLFEFIANLNKLDKAETFQGIIDMLRVGSENVKENITDPKFKNSYLLFINAMKKYTVINNEKNYLEIDVASFLNDLKNYYDANATSRFGPYLSLGLSQNFFLKEEFLFDKKLMPKDSLGNSINNIGFASEKLGIKYSLFKFNNYDSYKNTVDDIYLNKKDPIINDVYAILYGSGLLYSIANTTSSDKNFDYPHLGLGFGIRFFNALDANVSVGFPFIKDRNFLDDSFLSFGFDIPLGEYLERLGKSRTK